MTFGGYNKDQFHGDLMIFKLINTLHWSLGIRSIYYGDDIIQQYANNVGIADTGTSFIVVPEIIFNFISEKWKKQIGSQDNFRCENG